MSFTAITTQEIAVGEPVSNATQTKIKENFDNHESRLLTVEGGGNTVYPPIIFRCNGNPALLAIPYTGFLKTTCNFNLTITGVRLIIDTAGSAGSTEIDIKFKRGSDPYTSIFSTLPSLSYTTGADATSSNGVLNPTYTSLETGDIIRLDITSAQTASKNFIVRVDFTKT